MQMKTKMKISIYLLNLAELIVVVQVKLPANLITNTGPTMTKTRADLDNIATIDPARPTITGPMSVVHDVIIIHHSVVIIDTRLMTGMIHGTGNIPNTFI